MRIRVGPFSAQKDFCRPTFVGLTPVIALFVPGCYSAPRSGQERHVTLAPVVVRNAGCYSLPNLRDKSVIFSN